MPAMHAVHDSIYIVTSASMLLCEYCHQNGSGAIDTALIRKEKPCAADCLHGHHVQVLSPDLAQLGQAFYA